VRPFFSWWAREAAADNPFARADVPGIPETLIAVIMLDDIRRLLATCVTRSFENLRDRAVIMVLADCGIRLGELLPVHVDELTRRDDLLYVNGKSGPRVVPHGPATGEALAR
jgi:site-specific recombinase XerD